VPCQLALVTQGDAEGDVGHGVVLVESDGLAEELDRRVAVELRRFLALLVVQLVVLGHDGDAPA
jgi:hypothetical protein